jgi:hypothetical protein
MIDKAHLTGTRVLFRITRSQNVYSGTVQSVENDGIWIEAPGLLTDLTQDPTWEGAYRWFAAGVQQLKQPLFFVPWATLEFLLGAQD